MVVLSRTQQSVLDTLCRAIQTDSFPNILLYGPPGSGKKEVLNKFVEEAKFTPRQVYTVNCVMGIGINEVRNDINRYAASVVLPADFSPGFKLIVLHNADQLTHEAQSALRRCVEERTALTRFIFVTCNRRGILKPLQSRTIPLYLAGNVNTHPSLSTPDSSLQVKWMTRNITPNITSQQILITSNRAVLRGLSTLDVLEHLCTKLSFSAELASFFQQTYPSSADEKLGIILLLSLLATNASDSFRLCDTFLHDSFTDI